MRPAAARGAGCPAVDMCVGVNWFTAVVVFTSAPAEAAQAGAELRVAYLVQVWSTELDPMVSIPGEVLICLVVLVLQFVMLALLAFRHVTRSFRHRFMAHHRQGRMVVRVLAEVTQHAALVARARSIDYNSSQADSLCRDVLMRAIQVDNVAAVIALGVEGLRRALGKVGRVSYMDVQDRVLMELSHVQGADDLLKVRPAFASFFFECQSYHTLALSAPQHGLRRADVMASPHLVELSRQFLRHGAVPSRLLSFVRAHRVYLSSAKCAVVLIRSFEVALAEWRMGHAAPTCGSTHSLLPPAAENKQSANPTAARGRASAGEPADALDVILPLGYLPLVAVPEFLYALGDRTAGGLPATRAFMQGLSEVEAAEVELAVFRLLSDGLAHISRASTESAAGGDRVGLTFEEGLALYAYGTEMRAMKSLDLWIPPAEAEKKPSTVRQIYQQMNAAVREVDVAAPDAGVAMWRPLIHAVASALTKLQPAYCTVYRGVRLLPEDVAYYMNMDIAAHPTTMWNAFTSTSGTFDVACGFANIKADPPIEDGKSPCVFIIRTTTGRAVREYSPIHKENELLIPLGAKMEVLNVVMRDSTELLKDLISDLKSAAGDPHDVAGGGLAPSVTPTPLSTVEVVAEAPREGAAEQVLVVDMVERLTARDVVSSTRARLEQLGDRIRSSTTTQMHVTDSLRDQLEEMELFLLRSDRRAHGERVDASLAARFAKSVPADFFTSTVSTSTTAQVAEMEMCDLRGSSFAYP